MSGTVRTSWLSMHLPYACRHAGACCTAGWPIPLDRARLAAVAALRADRAWLRVVPAAPPDVAGLIAVSDRGRCVFRGDDCEIHRVAGHAALPAACQHFPRRVVIDARGVFVTLSHYCPTAAELLFTHEGEVAVVEGPPAVPDGVPEGLDARDVLPPLLRAPHHVRGDGARGPVLVDWDGYTTWESHMVDVLANRRWRPELALERLNDDLQRIREWHPGAESLAESVARVVRSRPSAERCVTGQEDDLILGRFLAAHAFASWAPYAAEGVGATLDHLRGVLAIVRAHRQQMSLIEAIRQTDLEVVHRA